jgi:hypothetical protein
LLMQNRKQATRTLFLTQVEDTIAQSDDIPIHLQKAELRRDAREQAHGVGKFSSSFSVILS